MKTFCFKNMAFFPFVKYELFCGKFKVNILKREWLYFKWTCDVRFMNCNKIYKIMDWFIGSLRVVVAVITRIIMY